MKHIVYAVILSLIIFSVIVSCGQRRYPPLLLAADSLCDVQPDSAVSLLLKLSPQMRQEDKAARMYYDLLRIKAADKTDKLNPSADSILALVAYYEGRGDKRLLPTAYYYAGRTYYELHDAPQALEYFQKAAEVDSYDNHLKSCIYNQMGYTFMYQGLFKESLKANQEACRYSMLSADTVDIIYSLRELSVSYEACNEHQKALYYAKKSHQLAKDYGEGFFQADTELYLANQYGYMGQHQKSLSLLKNSLRNVSLLDSSAVYSSLFAVYRALGMMDSALAYAPLIEKFGSVYAKDSLYKYLTHVCQQRGDINGAVRNYRLFLHFEDSLRQRNQTEATAKAGALYSYQQREKENARLAAENNRKSLVLLITVFAFLITLFAIAIIIIQTNKERKIRALRYMQLERSKSESIHYLEAKIEANNASLAELELQLSNTTMENEQLRHDLEHEKNLLLYSNEQANLKIDNIEKEERYVQNNPVVMRFFDVAHDDQNKVNDNDWLELEHLLDMEYCDFTSRLKSCVNLSDQEYRMSMLLKIGMRPIEISKILFVDDSTIGSRRSRLAKKHLGKHCARDWDEYIRSFH